MHRGTSPVATGRVHQHIDVAEAFQCLPHHFLDGSLVGQIHRGSQVVVL